MENYFGIIQYQIRHLRFYELVAMNLFQKKKKKNPKAMENNNVMIPFRVFFAFKIHFRINEEVCF